MDSPTRTYVRAYMSDEHSKGKNGSEGNRISFDYGRSSVLFKGGRTQVLLL
jgi:hypothetical protein